MDWKTAAKRKIRYQEFLVAVSDNNFEEMNRLIEEGIDINFKDQDGHMAIFIAIEHADSTVVEFLVDKGANLNVKNRNQESPVDLARRISRFDLLDILDNEKDCKSKNFTSYAKVVSKSEPKKLEQSVQKNKKYVLNNPIHGNIYQLKFLMLFMYRGVACKYSFRLGTEVKEARKFDDLVFEYNQGLKKSYRLLQVKHKIDESKKITVEKLLSEVNGDYNLVKYFHSYQGCKRDDFFKDGSIKDVTICTNIDFDLDNLKEADIGVYQLKEKDDILDLKSNEKEPIRYKFTDSVIPKLIAKLEYSKYYEQLEISNNDVEDFLQHLVFAVNQPNEEELGSIVKAELGKELDFITTENVYNKFFMRMLDWMKGRSDFISYMEGQELIENVRKGIFIWFNVQDPVMSFIGRQEQLNNIHELLQVEKNQIICVSGLGGVGKSELVKKYIADYGHYYDNKIIWMNAESSQTLFNSFRQLASDKLDISTINTDGKEKDANSIVSQVYQYFSNSKSLFIFDNAETYGSSNESDAGICRFLPSLPSGCNKPYIIITSRNKKWPESVKVKVLEGFTKKEAVSFVSKNLHLKTDKQKEYAKQLAVKLQLLPLALQQAVAYIKSQNEDLEDLGEVEKRFDISDYLERFEGKSKEILNFKFPNHSDNLYSKTVFTTWNVTLDDIKRKENGQDALDLLNIIAYLLPNDISGKLLSIFIQDKEKLESSIELLLEYSLIEIQNGMVNIHRLVQQVTRMKLVETHMEKDILAKCLNVTNKHYVNSKNISHFVSIWTYCRKYPALMKCYAMNLLFLQGKLVSCGRSKEAHDIGSQLTDVLQGSSSKDLEAQVLLSTIKNNNGAAFMTQYNYEQALKEFEESCKADQACGGLFNEKILATKSNMAGLLFCTGREEESFKCYQEILKIRELHYGEDHHETLLTKAYIAYFFFVEKDKCNEGLSKLQDICKKLETMLGSGDDSTFSVKGYIAVALVKLNRFEEALKFYQEILTYKKRTLVKNHPDTLGTRRDIAKVLLQLGRKSEALEMLNDVFKTSKNVLGENHEKTLETQRDLASLLMDMNKYDEALVIFQDVIIKQKHVYGIRNSRVRKTLASLAAIFAVQGKFAKALKILEELMRCESTLYGENDVKTLEVRVVAVDYYITVKKFNAALKLCTKVYQIQRSSFGMKDKRTLKSKHQIGMIYFYKKQFDQALGILEEVYKIQEAAFGKSDSVCLRTRHDIMVVTVERESHKNRYQPRITDPITAVRHDAQSVLEKLIGDGADVNTKDANNSSLLHHAINIESPKIIKFLLKNGADVACTSNKGNTPLHLAISKGDFEVVKALLEHVERGKLQAFIDAKTFKSGSTALHVAVKHDYLEIAKYLLMHGATYDLKNKDKQLPENLAMDRCVKDTLMNVDKLFELASVGNEELINTLKQYSVDEYLIYANARNSQGYNLMQVMVSNNYQKLVDLYHNLTNEEFHGVHLTCISNMNLDEFYSHANAALDATQNAKNSLDKALCKVSDFVKMFRLQHRCTSNPNVDTIEDMLRLFDSSESTSTFAKLAKDVIVTHLLRFVVSIQSTKLVKAVKSNNLNQVEKLLKERANVNVKENGGWTPLHHAINVNNEKMVYLLLSQGAKANCMTNTGKLTPLHIAVNKKHVNIVKLLLYHHHKDVLVDAKTEEKGSTALHTAVQNGQYEIVELLFAHYANYQLKNKAGQIPADLIDNEDIRGLFKLVDELFDDVGKGNIEVVKRLLGLNFRLLIIVLDVRNYDGYRLIEVAELNKLSDIQNKILKIETTIRANGSQEFHDLCFRQFSL